MAEQDSLRTIRQIAWRRMINGVRVGLSGDLEFNRL